MHSAIYQGRVSHRRFRPVRHDFRYQVRMLYLDLAELPALFDPFLLWSARRPAPAWFRRADHHGDPAVPLDMAVRDLVEREAGFRPAGAIRLLTHLRYFGYGFNPLSVYYCHDAEGALEAVVLEVSNMPWREMHPYVLTRGEPIANGGYRFAFAKAFHVSPFLPMDMEYRCRLAPPGARLALALENWRHGARNFDAHLDFVREPLDGRSLARLLGTDPLATLRVTALIHWQALKLWRKRAPVYDHAPAGGTR
ncbi:MAG: DUF1365 domain-containing protein [Gammaproteobacteria bacterium]|nr:DUF1365 domain-containing protein [Gammaproteobacteria bacterium]